MCLGRVINSSEQKTQIKIAESYYFLRFIFVFPRFLSRLFFPRLYGLRLAVFTADILGSEGGGGYPLLLHNLNMYPSELH